MTGRLWKILGPDRMPCHGGSGQWPEPGVWREVDCDLIPCKNGLHLARTSDLVRWSKAGAVVWAVEADTRKAVMHEPDKVVVRRARLVEPVGVLTDRVLRLAAAEFAADAAHLHGHHPACMQAIRQARLHAHGLTTEAARAAAWEAASAAARAAASAAARAAEWEAARERQGDHLLDLARQYGQVS